MPITQDRILNLVAAADAILAERKRFEKHFLVPQLPSDIADAYAVIERTNDNAAKNIIQALLGHVNMVRTLLTESYSGRELEYIIVQEREHFRVHAKQNAYQARYRRNRKAIRQYYEETAPIAQKFFNDPTIPAEPPQAAKSQAPQPAAAPMQAPAASPPVSSWRPQGDPNVKRDIPSPEELAKPPASPF